MRETRLEFAVLISEQAVWVEPMERPDIVDAHESDNRYLECAAVGHATYIITGNDHMLDLGEYEGIAILTPATFVTLWNLVKLEFFRNLVDK